MTKPQKQTIEVVDRSSDEGGELYALMDRLIEENHDHLAPANVALAWKYGWKPDADGRLQLGQCRKASELDQRLAGYDFAILLNHEAWHMDLNEDQRTALLDHELCHAAVKHDSEGFQAEDATGRKLWRVRKHDIEEFTEVVRRHGIYKRDLEAFARACAAKRDTPPLFKEAAGFASSVAKIAPQKGSGIESVTISSGGKSVTLTEEDGERLRRVAREAN